jgi:hypothetical protein
MNTAFVVRCVATVLALLAFSRSHLAGQTSGTVNRAANDGGSWRVPRTVDGHPNIEGVWNFATLTPLERPVRFAGKAFMTHEEATEFEKQTLQAVNGDRRGQTPASDLGGAALNEFWLERGPLATVAGRQPTSLVVDPPDGRLPALTPDAQRKVAARAELGGRADGPEDRSLAERCLRSASGPPMLPSADANLVKIVQTRDYAVILQEKFHDVRVVPFDGRPHVHSAIRTWVGDSRGRWSGDTLTIDTTNFTNQLALGARFDQSLHLIERFTRVGSNTLLYEFTVDDPTAFTKSWTVVLPMRRTGEQLYEFACHEGNYALPNILRGARFEEQAKRDAPNTPP